MRELLDSLFSYIKGVLSEELKNYFMKFIIRVIHFKMIFQNLPN